MKNFVKVFAMFALLVATFTLLATAECSHTYTSKVETPAMALKAGVKRYTCSKCGDTYTESIPATKNEDIGYW